MSVKRQPNQVLAFYDHVQGSLSANKLLLRPANCNAARFQGESEGGCAMAAGLVGCASARRGAF